MLEKNHFKWYKPRCFQAGSLSQSDITTCFQHLYLAWTRAHTDCCRVHTASARPKPKQGSAYGYAVATPADRAGACQYFNLKPNRVPVLCINANTRVLLHSNQHIVILCQHAYKTVCFPHNLRVLQL